jgi:citrate lyase subunit beta/citryl-CoA lyase
MPASLRPRRSALYVPGSNERALQKAKTVAADVLILDLEDSVAPNQKEAARDAVAAVVPILTHGRREIVVRVNGLDTPWVARDIAAMAAARPDAILVPKLSRTDDVRRARSAVAAAQAPREMRLWAMIETPAAVINAAAMAAIAAMPAPAVACYVIGTNDLAAEIGARIRPGRAALTPHLAQTVLAARAHDLAVLDGTFNDLLDEAGFRAECVEGRDLGMDGKTLIHPAQVAIANAVFAPSNEDIAWARRVVEAFAEPDNTGKGVIKLAGRMVERLHERQAKRTLELADTIAAMAAERAAAG